MADHYTYENNMLQKVDKILKIGRLLHSLSSKLKIKSLEVCRDAIDFH